MTFAAFCILAGLLLAPELTDKASVGMVGLSGGTWAAYGELEGFDRGPYAGAVEKYVFNKPLAVSVYGGFAGIGYHAALPWHWTVKRTRDGSNNRWGPGDMTLYAGKRWGPLEPRLGVIFPAGYDTRDGDPWIGQGNRQLYLGLGLRLPRLPGMRRSGAALDLDFGYALDDAIAKKGSWHVSPTLKAWKRLAESWKAEASIFGYWKSYYWGRGVPWRASLLGGPGPAADRKGGIVPGLGLEYRLGPRAALGLKGGHSLWGYRDVSSYHASVYLNYFPSF